MKKKTRILIIGLSALVLIGAAGVYASGLGSQLLQSIQESEENSITVAETEESRLFEAENTERKAQIDGSMSVQQTVGGVVSKFDQLLLAMDATIEDPKVYNEMLVNYMYLKDVRHMTDEQMDYLADLVIQGCSMLDIIDITYFWLDTNEDISIIPQIYALKPNYRNEYTWIENAFNAVTNDKCGVLDTEAVKQYRTQGMGADEIMYANKLCRKGVLTIQQILDKRLQGETWQTISAQINGESQIAAFSAAEDAMASEAAKALDTAEVVQSCEELAEITGESAAVYYSQAAEGADIAVMYEEEDAQRTNAVVANLRAQNLLREVPDETADENGEVE